MWKINLVGIPDKLLQKEWLGDKKYIAPADEAEAVGWAVGYYYATGKRATVFMSADGLANALNPITNLVIPEKIPIEIVVSYGRQESPHYIMSRILLPLKDLLEPNRIHWKLIKKES